LPERGAPRTTSESSTVAQQSMPVTLRPSATPRSSYFALKKSARGGP
jgi:hypothetical protein